MYVALFSCRFLIYPVLVGVPGIARDDQSRNLMDGVIFRYKEKGLHTLWKCVTVKETQCYRRKGPLLRDNAHMCTIRGTASSMNGMSCSRKNRIGLLYSARNVTLVLWDIRCSVFSPQEPEFEGLMGAQP
jgi:hypothetical protein